MTQMPDSNMPLWPLDYSPDRSFRAKIQRRMTQWRRVDACGPLKTSMITFSFDDFPKSAADTGAEIMASINAPAIYYACSGLAGRTNKTGELYDDSDLIALARAGHEIGAHTHTHLDCAASDLGTVLTDIDMNLQQLKDMGLEQKVRHFAYPFGETTAALKQALKGKFDTCRGILSGNNGARSDRLQLRAMELTPDPATTDRAIFAIETALQSPCWLHIFTHDVRRQPSPFGTTPDALISIARAAQSSGLPIVTPSGAQKFFAVQR